MRISADAVYTAHKKFMNGFAWRGCDPYGAIISTGRCQKTPEYKSANKFCFKGHIMYC